jgi:hypothetical protein
MLMRNPPVRFELYIWSSALVVAASGAPCVAQQAGGGK